VPSAVWPGSPDPSFLPSRKDDACESAPAWTADVTAEEITRALNAAGYRGTLTNLHIGSRNKSRRVATLRLDGMQPRAISGQDFRMAVSRQMGPLVVRSLAFEMKKVGTAYRFSGHGYGHGVGMCVIGSMNLATKGKTARAILNQYFPGLRIGPLP
jgi:stage II sporulation protein D